MKFSPYSADKTPMPYKVITTSIVVSSEQAPAAHEGMDTAVDQLLLHGVDIADSEVTEECADPPDQNGTA